MCVINSLPIMWLATANRFHIELYLNILKLEIFKTLIIWNLNQKSQEQSEQSEQSQLDIIISLEVLTRYEV